MPPNPKQPPDEDGALPEASRPIEGRDIYGAFVTEEDLAAYKAASPDVSLGNEIRLIRLIIARLLPNLSSTYLIVVKAILGLARVAAMQVKAVGTGTEMDELQQAGESALKVKETEK